MYKVYLPVHQVDIPHCPDEASAFTPLVVGLRLEDAAFGDKTQLEPPDTAHQIEKIENMPAAAEAVTEAKVLSLGSVFIREDRRQTN